MYTSNQIAESAKLIGDIKIGSGNFVSHGATIIGPITIGDNNFFGPNCVVGMPPQDDVFEMQDHISATLGYRSSEHGIQIGNRNVIREFVTVHQGLTSKTTIGNDCYLMAYAHIAHDCYIDDNVKIANNVQMGGYSTILRNSYIGLSAVLHQFTSIGAFVMIGMGSVVSKNLPPAILALGAPSRIMKVNRIALDKIGVPEGEWENLYLKSPAFESVHKNLKDDYLRFQGTVEDKIIQREEVSVFRATKN
jgi:UDP-N-acetylglucosamine acyltransferase